MSRPSFQMKYTRKFSKLNNWNYQTSMILHVSALEKQLIYLVTSHNLKNPIILPTNK